MSLQAMLWALKEAPTEGPNEALVLIALADHAGSSDSPWTGACPSHRTLSEAAQITTRTVRRCLADMERRGVIRRGDQSMTDKFRSDRRPVVWDLNGSMKRATGGHSCVRADSVSGRTNRASRGDTAVSYDPSLIDPSLNGASADAPSVPYPDDFEAFWSSYPKRHGPNPKKPAYGKWRTATKTTSAETILTAVKAYAAGDLPNDRSKIPQAKTWLEQERWTDQDTTDPGEWVRECWRRGDAQAIRERTGITFPGVEWPDDIPTNPQEREAIRVRQVRAWVETNRDQIERRLTHAG